MPNLNFAEAFVISEEGEGAIWTNERCFLHESTQRFYERAFPGLVGQKGRTKRVVDLEMASPVRHGRAVDQSRLRRVGGLAAMDEKL